MASIPSQIIPEALKPGDTIAFISPSARLNDLIPTPLSRSVKFFESKGYPVKVVYSPLPTSVSSSEHEGSIYLAKTRHIAQEIHTAFLDPKVTCIISAIGGTTINEVLRHIDYSIIRQNPKIFVGYSDNTLLVYAFFTKAGLRSFYGPTALTEFAEYPEPDPFTANHFFQVLLGKEAGGITGKQLPYSTFFTDAGETFLQDGAKEDTVAIRPKVPTPRPFFLRPGTATGPLIGGLLRRLVSLSGSPYLVPGMHKGAILLFEIAGGDDGPYPLARVRAEIVDLINTGLFDEIVGLVVGRTHLYDEKMNHGLQEIIGELVVGGGWKWPVLIGVDVGHTSPMLTIPFGAVARIDSENEEFCFLEEGVV